MFFFFQVGGLLHHAESKLPTSAARFLILHVVPRAPACGSAVHKLAGISGSWNCLQASNSRWAENLLQTWQDISSHSVDTSLTSSSSSSDTKWHGLAPNDMHQQNHLHEQPCTSCLATISTKPRWYTFQMRRSSWQLENKKKRMKVGDQFHPRMLSKTVFEFPTYHLILTDYRCGWSMVVCQYR